jgi:DNA-damage-inducible protein J
MSLKSDVVRARIEPGLKREAERVFRDLGLTHSQAISLFYHQVTLNDGLPFDLRIPNAETRAAIEEARHPELLKGYTSIEELRADLDLDGD